MAFRGDKLTIKAQEAVARAQSSAADQGHAEIAPLHLLAGLLAESEGIVNPILERIGVNRAQLDRIVQSELSHFAKVSGGSTPTANRELAQVFEAAQREADAMKDEFVSTEHLLLALTKADSKAKRVLKLNSRPDYRERLGKELAVIHDSEMWQAGETTRALRPENWKQAKKLLLKGGGRKKARK
jgi:ATP-dependent Clp protease ATP-binding subunit ClpB